ncbi:hypothetical protein T08_1228 [Trichinella sp. T8]|nr:hypothetical protein T08_1228 [Trichinella sp. T8]
MENLLKLLIELFLIFDQPFQCKYYLRMKQNCINTSSEKFLTCVALAEVKIEAARTLRNQQIHSF